jgi:hypothetical protein
MIISVLGVSFISSKIRNDYGSGIRAIIKIWVGRTRCFQKKESLTTPTHTPRVSPAYEDDADRRSLSFAAANNITEPTTCEKAVLPRSIQSQFVGENFYDPDAIRRQIQHINSVPGDHNFRRISRQKGSLQERYHVSVEER